MIQPLLRMRFVAYLPEEGTLKCVASAASAFQEALQDRHRDTGRGILIGDLVVVLQAGFAVDLDDRTSNLAQGPRWIWRDQVHAGQADAGRRCRSARFGDQILRQRATVGHVVAAGVLTGCRLHPHDVASRGDRVGGESLPAQGEDGVEVQPQQRANEAPLGEAKLVLAFREGSDRRATVPDEFRWLATHDVEQVAVDEQQAIHQAGRLPLDQQTVAPAPALERRSQ